LSSNTSNSTRHRLLLIALVGVLAFIVLGEGQALPPAWAEAPAAVPATPAATVPTQAEIDKLVDAAVDRRVKDKDVVEVGLALKAADMLFGWAKLFGLLVIVPTTLFFALLGWFGIREVKDVRDIVQRANETLAATRNSAEQADKVAQATKEISSKPKQRSTKRSAARPRSTLNCAVCRRM
jgi:hypothetical protein